MQATRQLAMDYAKGHLLESDLGEQAISDRLWTAGLPDADLVIRTSGEERMSNFLLWQSAYAELVFSPVPWPAFDTQALLLALQDFDARSRRFGA